METALQKLFVVSRVEAEENVPKALAIWSTPVVQCGFHKKEFFQSVNTYVVSCFKEIIFLRNLLANFTSLTPSNWVSEAAVDSLAANRCWVDCLGRTNGLEWMKKYLQAQAQVRSRALLGVFDDVCLGANCVQASLALWPTSSTQKALIDGLFVAFPDKIICLFAILINATVVALGVILLVLALFVWKIFSAMKFYIALLSLVRE